MDANGVATYTPNSDFNGTDTITYTLSDGNGGTVTETITVTVTAENDAPTTPSGRTETTAEDTPASIDLLAGSADVDGDTVTVDSASALNGTITVDANGVATYTPNPDFNGTDTITYTVSDGNGGTTTETITVTVTAENDAPTNSTSGRTETVTEDTPAAIDLLDGITDADGDALTLDAADALNGTVTVDDNGVATYTPNPDFNGTDTITYTVSDGNGGTTTETITVTVTAENDAPTNSTSGRTETVTEDTPAAIDLLDGITDADGDALTVDAADALNGTVTVDDNGVATYTPNPDFNGTDTITYTVSDGNGGTTTETITVTVTAENDAPTNSTSGRTETVTEDTPAAIDLLDGITDADGDALTVDTADALNGTVTVDDNGVATYTPNLDFNGTDTITYTVSDGSGGTTTETITVTVTAENDAPTSSTSGRTETVTEDTPAAIDLLDGITDADGDVLTVDAADALNGTVTVDDNGVATYTPNPDFNGTDTITYTVSDGSGGTTTETITVTVTAENDAPTSSTSGRTETVTEDTPAAIDLLDGITDADGDVLTVDAADALNGTVTVDDNGVATYTPNPDFVGEDTITYTVDDGNGGTITETITVIVEGVNDNPVVADLDNVSVEEDTQVEIDITDQISDPDGTTPRIEEVTAGAGTAEVSEDGTITYTPPEDFTGTDTIELVITDDEGGQTTTTIVVDVTPVNDAPVVDNNPDVVEVVAAEPIEIDPITIVSDPDGDELTLESATSDQGTVEITDDNTIIFTPDPDSSGEGIIEFTVTDGETTVTGTIPVDIDGPAFVTEAQDSDSDIPVPEAAEQVELQLDDYSEVLLQAVDGVKRLNGLADLSSGSPTAALVASLGNGDTQTVELGATDNNIMQQAVGDLNESARTPLDVTEDVAGISDTDAAETIEQRGTPSEQLAKAPLGRQLETADNQTREAMERIYKILS